MSFFLRPMKFAKGKITRVTGQVFFKYGPTPASFRVYSLLDFLQHWVQQLYVWQLLGISAPRDEKCLRYWDQVSNGRESWVGVHCALCTVPLDYLQDHDCHDYDTMSNRCLVSFIKVGWYRNAEGVDRTEQRTVFLQNLNQLWAKSSIKLQDFRIEIVAKKKQKQKCPSQESNLRPSDKWKWRKMAGKGRVAQQSSLVSPCVVATNPTRP